MKVTHKSSSFKFKNCQKRIPKIEQNFGKQMFYLAIRSRFSKAQWNPRPNCDFCTIASLKQVMSEPILQEFWDTQRFVLFDICVFHADVKSFQNQELQAVYETKKKIKNIEIMQ